MHRNTIQGALQFLVTHQVKEGMGRESEREVQGNQRGRREGRVLTISYQAQEESRKIVAVASQVTLVPSTEGTVHPLHTEHADLQGEPTRPLLSQPERCTSV